MTNQYYDEDFYEWNLTWNTKKTYKYDNNWSVGSATKSHIERGQGIKLTLIHVSNLFKYLKWKC
jgi:hypothetical protein